MKAPPTRGLNVVGLFDAGVGRVVALAGVPGLGPGKAGLVQEVVDEQGAGIGAVSVAKHSGVNG